MLLAGLVVHQHALLHGFRRQRLVDVLRFRLVRFQRQLRRHLQRVVGAAAVAARVARNQFQRIVVRRQLQSRPARALCPRPPAAAVTTIRSSLSGCSTYTRQRDSSAEIISNEGFSVVAPISRIVPRST